MLNIDRETLTETARWYGLEPTVAALYRAFQGDVDSTDDLPVFPPNESEYMTLEEQYGVS
jgi:hypothetical protein